MSREIKQLTTDEVAARLGVTPSRVRQMIRAGQLPATRFGKAHLIFEKDLELVRERPVGRPPASTQDAPVPAKRATGQTSASKGAATAKRRGSKAAR